MRKTFLFLMAFIFMASSSFANTSPGWLKNIPASTENPQAISADVTQNNTALDLMLQNYRDGHVTITLVSTSEIDIGPGGVMLQNSGGSLRLMVANSSLTAVSSTMIDTGTISASSTYYLYAYASSTTATTFSVIFSASSTIPTGITYYARLGSFTTDTSKNFVGTTSDVNQQVGFGSWQTKTVGTIYQATTDGFLVAVFNIAAPTTSNVSLITDSSSTPTTVRQIFQGSADIPASASCPVRKGDYYEVTTTAYMGTEYFISNGS